MSTTQLATKNKLPLGELFILGFNGEVPPKELEAFSLRHSLGGVILFDYDCTTKTYERNIKSPEQVRELCAQVHGFNGAPLVTIDQEGGKVRRLKEDRGFAALPSAKEIMTLSASERDALLLAACTEMRTLGIDLDLAPVVDVAYNPQSPGLGSVGRLAGGTVDEARTYALSFIAAARLAGLGLCLKHYPGLGSAPVDSHADFTTLAEPFPEDQVSLFIELAPRTPGNAVLICHGVVPSWSGKTPITMHAPTLSGLRAQLQHTVFISDDLQMQGLLKTRGIAQACVDGLAAGLDMLILGNNLMHTSFDELEGIIESIYELAARNKIFAAALHLKLQRVARLKRELLVNA